MDFIVTAPGLEGISYSGKGDRLQVAGDREN
jgi:hypothetical protein